MSLKAILYDPPKKYFCISFHCLCSQKMLSDSFILKRLSNSDAPMYVQCNKFSFLRYFIVAQ